MRSKLLTKGFSQFARSWAFAFKESPVYSTFRKYPDDKSYISIQSINYMYAIKGACPHRYQDPLDVIGNWWCQLHDPLSPLAECGFAIHKDSTVSAVVTARYGAAQKVIEHFQQHCPGNFGVNKDPNYTGVRLVVAVEAQLSQSEKILKFLDAAKALSPKNFPSEQFCKIIEYAQLDEIKQMIALAGSDCTDRTALENLERQFPFPLLPNHHHVLYPCQYSLSPYAWERSRRFDPRIYLEFPNGLTPLSKAVRNNKIKDVRSILAKDPFSAVKPDAYNRAPLQIAQWTNNHEIFVCLYEHAKNLPIICRSMKNGIDFVTRIMAESAETFYKSVTREQAKKWKEDLKKEAKTKAPQRHPIHHACLANNQQAVLNLLDANPELIKLEDPWGFNIVVMACAMGHVELLERLLLRGAEVKPSHDTYLFPSISLVHNAANEEVLKILFHHYADPNERTSLIEESIRNRRINLLKQFYRYGRDDLRNDLSLTPIEQAMHQAQTTGDYTVLKWLLFRQEDYVYAESLDPETDRRIVELLNLHNGYIDKRRYNIQSRPALLAKENVTLSADKTTIESKLVQTLVIQDQESESYLKQQHHFSSYLMSTADLTWQLEQFKEVYLERLKLRSATSAADVNEYMKKTFPKNRSLNTFVEYFMHEGKIISFLTFTVREEHHHSVGNFIFFWAMLASVRQNYSTLGLNTFVMRVPHAIKQSNLERHVVGNYKSIRPGYSYVLADSNGSHIYPKYHHDTEFMRYVASLTGEEMIGKGLAVAINKVDEKPDLTPVLEDYEELVGDNMEHGLLVTWMVTPDSIDSYLKKKLPGSQLDTEKMNLIGQYWATLYQENAEKIKMEMLNEKSKGIGSKL